MRCEDTVDLAEQRGCTAELEAASACEDTLEVCQTGCTDEVNAWMRCLSAP